nr:hypothetical protein [Bifidobacterium indicum]
MFYSLHTVALSTLEAAHSVHLWAKALPYRMAADVVLAADAQSIFNDVKGILVTWVSIGGGLWLVWGAVAIAGALNDQNGPELKQGVWKTIGGAMVIVVAQLFGHVV